jgi:hypothetical protein
MPKLVTEKIRNIIKNHVSLNGKIIEIHLKNKCFVWFGRLRTRKVKVSKKHQKCTKIQSKFDEQPIQNSCSKKGYPKHGKSSTT